MTNQATVECPYPQAAVSSKATCLVTVVDHCLWCRSQRASQGPSCTAIMCIGSQEQASCRVSQTLTSSRCISAWTHHAYTVDPVLGHEPRWVSTFRAIRLEPVNAMLLWWPKPWCLISITGRCRDCKSSEAHHTYVAGSAGSASCCAVTV